MSKYQDTITIHISTEQREYINKLKKEKRTTASDVIRIMIKKYMEQNKK